jgi:hypothetical protein
MTRKINHRAHQVNFKLFIKISDFKPVFSENSVVKNGVSDV